MKTLNIEQMENVEGGMACWGAVAMAAFCGILIVGTVVYAPQAWLFPKTWYGASVIVTGNVINVVGSCGGE